MPLYRGSCLCGMTAFELNAEPILHTCCHCSNCKKYTGTILTTNVVFPCGCQKITQGEDLVSTFRDTIQDSGNSLVRYFCSKCGSPLYNTTLDPNGNLGMTIAVFTSALEDEELSKKQPEMEYYAKDRVEWLPPFNGAARANTKPGRDD